MKTENEDDLSQLEQIDDTIILKALKTRYEKDIIYTNCGDILIAMNPCRELPIFGENHHMQYDWQNFSEISAPHVFQTAARAFRRMHESATDQVIIVTGESGAGKTESTKFMVKHFVHMCQSDNKEFHEKIIKVNPLLEAFGNARTHMNRNSSRFAKYLELGFSEHWDLTGVIIRDYILEKSRVVHRFTKEGNFHAFYSLLHGAPKRTLKALFLENSIDSYRIMQSDSDNLKEEARYKEMYIEQNKILQQIKTSPHDVDSLLAAVIHLTEIKFVESPNVAGASILSDKKPANCASELLSLRVEDLIEALVSTKMAIQGDKIRRNKSPQQAAEGRDALAKMLYERLFQWLVYQINADLHPNSKGSGRLLRTGILDIAGFEKLETNSLEQLCINIVNERLQNFMNERLFRFELQAYKDEGIDIGDVSFKNNDDLISFLTKPRNSVLDILDEQSTLQHGSDIAFVRQLTELYKDSGIYIPPVTNHPEFTVLHFAGKVTYNAAGFLVKNRDLLNPELKDCMKCSRNDIISELFKHKPGPTGTKSASLLHLVDRMSRAEHSFVRCLKPNEGLTKSDFSDVLVSEQLKYNGISQMVKLRNKGFTYRQTYEEFVLRYSDILPDAVQVQRNRYKEAATVLLASGNIPSQLRKDFRIGKTKIFMKKRLFSWMEGVLHEVHNRKKEERRREEEEIKIKEEERKKEEEVRKRKEEEVRKREEEEERLHREMEDHCKSVELRQAIDAKEVPKGMKRVLQSKLKHIRNIGGTPAGSPISNSNYDEDHEVRAEHQCIRIPQNWKMGESIGSGAFGTVYKVLGAGTHDEQFAVKQIAFSISKETIKVMEILKKDVTMFKGLEHKRIAKYYGWAEKNHVFSIFLEYAQNHSVDDFLQSEGALEDNMAMELVRQVLEGLAFLHAHGIVHRDLKASNILLDGDMNAKLCDIGLSATLETHPFANRGCTTIVGSCFWASPEVVKGEASNVKMDVWSLGCTIVELVTAQRPWYPHPPYTALLRIGCDLSPLGDAYEQFNISDIMKEFLDPMFNVDATKRPSAQDMLSHSVYSL